MKRILSIMICWLLLFISAVSASAELSSVISYPEDTGKMQLSISGLSSLTDYCLLISDSAPGENFDPSRIRFIRQFCTAESGELSVLLIYSNLTGCGIYVGGPDGVTALGTVTEIYQADPDFLLPQSLTVIDDGAFENCAFMYAVVENGVTKIGSRAFANCPNLRCIELPDSIASTSDIAADAFSGCEGLVIRCSEGSAANAFASAHNYHVELIGENTEGGSVS